MSGSTPKPQSTNLDRVRTATYRPPVELEPGVWRLRVAQPRFAANYVYVLLGSVPTLIDSGHPDPETQAQLDRGLEFLGLQRKDIAQILYTHTHLDHLGGGMKTWGTPELRHVEHRLPEGAVKAGVDTAFGAYTIRLHEWFEWMETLPDHPYLDGLRAMRSTHPEGSPWLRVAEGLGRTTGRPLVPGTFVSAGDLRLEILDVHGHDPHHIAFVEENTRWAVTGDIIVGTPTPLVPPMGDDALPYREALDRIADLAPDRVFPAHGLVFDNGRDAIRSTAAHFDAFSASILRNLGRLGVSGPVGAAAILQTYLDRDPSFREADRALPGVLLGGIHAHLTRLERLGAARQPEPNAFLPEAA